MIKFRHEQELALFDLFSFRYVENCSSDSGRSAAVFVEEGSPTIKKPADSALVRDPELHPIDEPFDVSSRARAYKYKPLQPRYRP